MTDYASLSREELISRLEAISPSPKLDRHFSPSTGKKSFDFSLYPRRKIALRFCYFGWNYSGLAIQESHTLLPTVESVLFDALVKTRLVDSAGGLEGCGWSRCGRTDRGVSAAGQVMALWVRSNLRRPSPSKLVEHSTLSVSAESSSVGDLPTIETDSAEEIAQVGDSEDPAPSQSQEREIPYVHKLNHVLPPSIRILAWSPVSDDFDARFSCKYRHYKYIFTTGSNTRNNIPLMRHAASKFVGEHDFRNFCKLDPTKQITNYKRKVLRATIEPFQNCCDGDNFSEQWSNTLVTVPGMYVFDLVGTAFLYHQVRHMMAILFLVGSGLEHPDVIDAMLKVEPGPGDDESASQLPIVETKPMYRMADSLPLVLWDCSFDPADVAWQDDTGNLLPLLPPYDLVSHSDPFPISSSTSQLNPPLSNHPRHSRDSLDLFNALHKEWTQNLIRTSIAALFVQASHTSPRPRHALSLPSHPSTYASLTQPQRVDEIRKRGKLPRRPRKFSDTSGGLNEEALGHVYDLGGGETKGDILYVPLLKRERGATVEEINGRWRDSLRGQRNMERMKSKADKLT